MFCKIKNCLYITFILLSIGGCKKYLDKKPDKSIVIASALKDLQALLDNYSKMNRYDPAGGEISCDNYYLSSTDWNGLSDVFRRMYIWGDGDYFSEVNNMWFNMWQPVYIANTVLDILPGIEKIKENQAEWDDIKGQALFFRAKEFHHIALTWALAYDSTTSKTDLGIPLHLNSDFNEKSTRFDLETTYARIVSDLKEAIPLLAETTITAYRPSKPAAYAMLSRVYLSMRKYDQAGKYADSCLRLYSNLLDYNKLNPSDARPIPKLNAETIFYSEAGNWEPLTNSRAKIDSFLYSSFNNNDLRKTIFFKNNNNGTFGFKATYTGGTAQLSGPATDEVYLMRAECYARAGNIHAAMDDLNTLLITRWKSGTFIPFNAVNAKEALNIILSERRKELIYRELRWMDIKRLNKEGANITLKRIVEGQTYVLQPNDLRYALPIPDAVIRISGMPQNPR